MYDKWQIYEGIWSEKSHYEIIVECRVSRNMIISFQIDKVDLDLDYY